MTGISPHKSGLYENGQKMRQILPDAELLPALTRLAAERGLRLPADSAQYILRRCPRDLGYLQGLLERLDRASLAAQRRLTLPFVREQLRQRE